VLVKVETHRDYNEDIEGWVISRPPVMRIEDLAMYNDLLPRTEATGSAVLIMEAEIDTEREILNKKEFENDKASGGKAPPPNTHQSYTLTFGRTQTLRDQV
jgi:hypothetical protein